jgi:hypothetical protein
LRRGAAGVVAVVLVFAVAAVHGRMSPEPHALRGGEAFVPRPEMAKVASLGFEAILSDLHWLRAVQIAGSQDFDPSRHATLLGRLIDVVTTLDPWVDHPYRFAAIWMTDSAKNVREANRLLERGIRHHPDDWRGYFYEGFNHFYYLGENEKAAAELEKAAALPGSPPYLGRLVARLRSENGDLDAAAIFLAEMVQDAPDERRKAQYLAALDEIQVEQRARFLDRAREEYRRRHGRDVQRVEDLLMPPDPVLRSLPPAEPSSLPAQLRRGSRWVLDPDDGRIVSSYYGRRYEVHFNAPHRFDSGRQDARAGAQGEADGG